MNSTTFVSTPTLAEVILLPQIGRDISSRADSWFVAPSGLNPNEWSIGSTQVVSASAVTRVELIGLPEALASAWRMTRSTYRPKTALGRRLWEIRKRIVASGEPLLGWKELEKEIAERRGEPGM